MQSTKVKVSDSLTGTWVHGKFRRQLVIMCHGFQSSSKNSTLVYIARALEKLDYDTFAFSFSPNTGGFDIKHQVQDIAQVAGHFADYAEIVLIGASFAGLTTAISTIQIPAVTRLITLNGFFGLGLLGKPHRQTYRKFRIAAIVIPKYYKIYHYYKTALQPAKITVPVLVMHAISDKYVFKEQSEWFYGQLITSKKFVELQHANHGVTVDTDRDEVVDIVHAWLRENSNVSNSI